MLLTAIKIKNIRSLGDVVWEPPSKEKPEGWHVVIGDNGSGKSTFLRSIALAFVGRENALALRQDFGDWLNQKNSSGTVRLDLDASEDDTWAVKGRKVTKYYLLLQLHLKRVSGQVELQIPSFKKNPLRHAWSDKRGWFSASFGPFRRFQGGDKEAEKLFYSHPKLARHLSVFGENVALSECLSWLRHLYLRELEMKPDRHLLGQVKKFINQCGVLPHGVRFDKVNSEDVRFVDGNGIRVPVSALGDGFRSVLSFAFELIRQMVQCFGPNNFFEEKDGRLVVRHTGVVLIDEIDAHLHPTWQRQIGFWLTDHFPKVQFIVTTHSPLVCHAAERGSIFRLATPGTEEKPRMAEGLERDRLIFGSVLDAYSTELFGHDVSRSASAQVKQKRLAELNQRAISGEKLSDSETKERIALRALFPSIVDEVV